ncbi:unnamed protein product [Brachionus calyciflorus]|uniref:Uncharacterized protein n=1 Tax=Brachionus calyciflorus TaxID=104777 RepID=A0A813ZWL0_9BILA|nr:unnamed protein product [Brachionus calyciflorus]
MLLNNFNTQHQFVNPYQVHTNLTQTQQPINYSLVIQPEFLNTNLNQIKKNEFEPEKNTSSNLNDDEHLEQEIDEFNLTTNEKDEDYLYLTIDLPIQAVNKLKSLSLEQLNQIKQLGILGIQFENDTSTIKLENMNLNEESHGKKRPRKTVMELSVSTNNSIQECEPKNKKSKIKENDNSIDHENMSEDLKNIYQIRQMLSQQAQKEDEMEKMESNEKPKKQRTRAPADPNKPKVKRKNKNENQDVQINNNNNNNNTQLNQPPVRINQIIQQSAYNVQQQNIYHQQNQQPTTQNHYSNNQEQMKIRNILYSYSNQNIHHDQNVTPSIGFIDQQQQQQQQLQQQQKLTNNNNFLILNSNLNSTSDCNSNSNMTSNSDLSLTNNSYAMNIQINNNQINFLNI